MDITTSKNIAFSLFTFSPLVLCALITLFVAWVISLFRSGGTNYRRIWKAFRTAALIQVGFILLTIVAVLFASMFNKTIIPAYGGGLLVLVVSTFIAVIWFLCAFLKDGNKGA